MWGFFESFIERVIPKLRKLYQNWESYIEIVNVISKLRQHRNSWFFKAKKCIKFLANLPKSPALDIKRKMKVLTWFGRASVAQCAPMGPVCPMRPALAARPITMCRLESLPPNGRFTVLHCISMHRPAWAVIYLFLKQMGTLCVKTFKQHFLFLNYRLQNQGSHQRPNRIDFCSHCDKVLNFSFVGVLSWPI